MSTVGWEPDTFGHAGYLPQLLRQAGIKYYYHSREENHPVRVPVYWWEGIDGSRLLSFDEGVTNWYMGSPDMVYTDLKAMKERSGVNTALTIVGVGNHGGAPSREMIEKGLEIAAKPYLSTIKFGTAEEFFKDLETRNNLSELEVFRGELNPVFSGGTMKNE